MDGCERSQKSRVCLLSPATTFSHGVEPVTLWLSEANPVAGVRPRRVRFALILELNSEHGARERLCQRNRLVLFDSVSNAGDNVDQLRSPLLLASNYNPFEYRRELVLRQPDSSAFKAKSRTTFVKEVYSSRSTSGSAKNKEESTLRTSLALLAIGSSDVSSRTNARAGARTLEPTPNSISTTTILSRTLVSLPPLKTSPGPFWTSTPTKWTFSIPSGE